MVNLCLAGAHHERPGRHGHHLRLEGRTRNAAPAGASGAAWRVSVMNSLRSSSVRLPNRATASSCRQNSRRVNDSRAPNKRLQRVRQRGRLVDLPIGPACRVEEILQLDQRARPLEDLAIQVRIGLLDGYQLGQPHQRVSIAGR